MTDRNKIIPAVYLVLLKDRKVLLIRRFQTGFQDGNYSFVAGHVEADEPPTAALCREAKEEVGITIHPADLHFEQILYRRSFRSKGSGYVPEEYERADFFFSCTKWKGEIRNAEPGKCDDIQWFPLDELPKNLFPIVRTFLEEHPHHNAYQETGY